MKRSTKKSKPIFTATPARGGGVYIHVDKKELRKEVAAQKKFKAWFDDAVRDADPESKDEVLGALLTACLEGIQKTTKGKP